MSGMTCDWPLYCLQLCDSHKLRNHVEPSLPALAYWYNTISCANNNKHKREKNNITHDQIDPSAFNVISNYMVVNELKKTKILLISNSCQPAKKSESKKRYYRDRFVGHVESASICVYRTHAESEKLHSFLGCTENHELNINIYHRLRPCKLKLPLESINEQKKKLNQSIQLWRWWTRLAFARNKELVYLNLSFLPNNKNPPLICISFLFVSNYNV